MKPKRPLPSQPPFLTLLTHAYRRPKGLAANFASVAGQTAVEDLEQVVLPDHLGVSPADAVYGRRPWHARTPRGAYVHVLGDDDVLASPDAVARLRAFTQAQGQPPVVVVRCRKGGTDFPKGGVVNVVNGTAQEGDVDLCCFVLRRDIWEQFAETYGRAYRCDWDGFLALQRLAPGMATFDFLFAIGAEGSGRPEVDW